MIPCIKNILPFLLTHFMTHHPNLPHLAVFGARFLPHCTPPPHHTHAAFLCITSHPNASLSTSSYRFWYIIPSNLAVFSSPLQPTKRAPHPNLSIFTILATPPKLTPISYPLLSWNSIPSMPDPSCHLWLPVSIHEYRLRISNVSAPYQPAR